ncbi:MAG: DUF3108 domain-containing protein [Terriglobia bacterium]
MIKISVALLIITSVSPGRAQAPGHFPFAPGETLTYDVNWSIFTAGRVVATLLKPGNGGTDPTEIITTARTQGFASLLFKVQDDFDSFFNPQTLCSRRILKKVNENNRRREISIVFNTDRGVAVQDDRDLNTPKAPPKHVENKISGCVEDIVTAFYFLRHQPLRVGQDIHVTLNDGGQTHDVTVEVQAREQLHTALGNRMAFRLEPKIFGTLYNKKGRLLVWLSDDAQRLPLQIKMTISVGTITGNLKSVTMAPANGSPGH